MAGATIAGPVVVFDDDHYYVGSAIAEQLALQGKDVTYVTSAGRVSEWSSHTAEQARVQARLIGMGISIIVNASVPALGHETAIIRCVFSGNTYEVACGGFVPVTSREPDDGLWRALKGRGLVTLVRVGDCKAPGLIAQAVFDGHRFAQEFDEAGLVVRRERVSL